MGLIRDLDSPSLVLAPRRTRSRRIGIVPRAVAEAGWEEACVYLNASLPRRWIMELAARAQEIYDHSSHFQKLLRSPGRAGRDYLGVQPVTGSPPSSPNADPTCSHDCPFLLPLSRSSPPTKW
jgi:hypothetical protein